MLAPTAGIKRGRDGKPTHVYGGLHARLDAGALEGDGDLANGGALNGGGGDAGGEVLGVGQLVVDGLGAGQGHDEGGVGEAVLHGEVDAVLLDVGDDDGARAGGLAHGGAQQADGPGAEDQDGGARLHVGPRPRVHGHRERLHDGAGL